MCSMRPLHTLGRAASRFLTALGLCGFLVANTGLPVVQPVVSTAKDTSKPFPCQNRPCGCMSQEACMRGCCCFSASQRLAWAQEHGVIAPEELVAAAAHEHDHDDGPTAKTCCTAASHTTSESACADGRPVHDRDNDKATRAHAHDEPTAPQWRVTLVIGTMASHCHGLGPLSVLAFSALPPAAVVNDHIDPGPAGWIEIVSLWADSVAPSSLLRLPAPKQLACGAHGGMRSQCPRRFAPAAHGTIDASAPRETGQIAFDRATAVGAGP